MPSQTQTDCRLPAKQRLRRERDFDRVFAEGKVIRTKELIVRAAPNGLGFPRLGLSVGKAVGNAVIRNRVKRVLREAFRLNKHLLPGGYDLVVVPRREWKDYRLAAVEPAMRQVLTELAAWPQKQGGSVP